MPKHHLIGEESQRVGDPQSRKEICNGYKTLAVSGAHMRSGNTTCAGSGVPGAQHGDKFRIGYITPTMWPICGQMISGQASFTLQIFYFQFLACLLRSFLNTSVIPTRS